MLKLFIFFSSLFLLFSFIHYAAKKKKPFKRAFLSIMCGMAALVTVNLLSGFTGVYIPVTVLTLTASAAGGVPGVAVLVILTAL